jgi:hypothetical protein
MTTKAITSVEEEFVRLYFITSHILEIGGAKLSHELGKFYHVSRAEADKLIEAGIARLDSEQEKLEADRIEALRAAELSVTAAKPAAWADSESSTAKDAKEEGETL